MTKFVMAAFAACTLFFSVSAANAAPGPAFNCRYASLAAEQAICASGQLSRLDRKLNRWYAKARQRAGYFGQTRWLKQQQRAWLARRNACGWNRFCIAQKYRNRIRALRRYYEHV